MPTRLRLLPQPDPLLARVITETLTMELPELHPKDQARVAATVLGLLVTTAEEHQPTRYAMSVLLATPCRRCGQPIGWEPFSQGWVHYRGPDTCSPDHVAAHGSELARRLGDATRAATRAATERDHATHEGRDLDARQAGARAALASTLAGALSAHLHATP